MSQIQIQIFQTIAPKMMIDYISDNAESLDLDYYYGNSYQKWLSPIVINLMEQFPNDYINKISDVIVQRYKTKWSKIYNTLYKEQYEPLKNYYKTITDDEIRNETKNETNKLDSNSSDVKDSTRNTVEKTDTNLTTTTSSSDKNNVYGFNSSASVGDNESDSQVSENTEGSGEKNKSDRNETINDSTTNTRNETNTNDLTSNTQRNKNKAETGLINSSSQDLIIKEMKLRTMYNFIQIMYNDLDSVLCLLVY